MHDTNTYTLPEAREQLDTTLQDALSGEKVCLEQGGKTVAVLLSMEEFDSLQARSAATRGNPGRAVHQVRRAGPEDAKAWKRAFEGVGSQGA